MARDNGYDYLFSRTTMIEHHLRYNHYPPITSSNAVDIALQAIYLCEQERDDEPVQISGQYVHAGGGHGEVVTAGEIVEGWHLSEFIELDNE
jgi:hypothetical protein